MATVLITGASLGVGRACAEAFHADGANVVLLARREAPLQEVAEALGGERVLVIAADVQDNQALADAVTRTVEHFGELTGLVNNAGAHFRGALAKRTPDELATMVDVNLRAPIVLTRLALPHLEASKGFVVNVASLAGKVPLDGAATYSATKFGLRAFTFAMADEIADTGVTVSVVSPGPIETSFILGDLDQVEDIALSQTMCTAEDVARMVVASARDGRWEREFPVSGGKMATLGYLFPGLRRLLKPVLKRRGQRAKERLRSQQ